MNTDTVIIFIILVCLFFFALYKEKKDYRDAYVQSLPDEKDTKIKIYTKLYHCLSVNKKTIKWRRCFITTFVSLAIYYGFVLKRIPEPKELILGIFVFYIIYYISWDNYVETVNDPVLKIGKEHIKRVRYL